MTSLLNRIPHAPRGAARRILSAAVHSCAVLFVALAANAAELSQKKMVERGRELFLTAGGVGCAACHGPYAEGDVGIGPYNRGMDYPAIRNAIASVEDMAFLADELTDIELQQIAAYYLHLGKMQLVKALAKRGRFVPDRVMVHPGTRVQLVVQNSSRRPQTFASDDMGFGEVTVSGREDLAVEWQAPDEEGTHVLRCTDCRLQGERLEIVVSRSAPEYRGTQPETKEAARREAEEVAAPAQPAPAISDPVAVAAGRDLFQTAGDVGCVACHGKYAEGDVGIGPYNRGFSAAAIRGALDNVPAMAFLRESLNGREIDEIAAYYDWLGRHQLVKTVNVRGVFVPSKLQIRPGTEIQLVIENRSLRPRTFASVDMQIAPIEVEGRESNDIVWEAPRGAGEYHLSCSNCPIRGQDLVIEVSSSAPLHRAPVALR